MTLISEIKKYLKARPHVWVSGSEIERLALSLKYKASHGDRRGRDIVNEKHNQYCAAIERRINEKRCVEYMYSPEKEPTYQAKPSSPQPLFQLAPKSNSINWAQ